jgi:glycerol-1-phosphate dehydrogenase [NAD(P)+]
MECLDPTDITHINERLRAWAASGEQIFPVGIDRIAIEDDGIDTLDNTVQMLSSGRHVLLIMDRTPMRRGGDDLKALIEDRLARVCRLTVRHLPEDPSYAFHAEIEAARQIADDLADFAAIVSIGSGSITDVAKYARHLHAEETGRKVPFVSFPTAASVTAYTSALAALLVDGVKRSFASAAPDVVICDLRTLADAPLAMTKAGFGDVLARGVSYGDWYLANRIGMDDGFSLVPGKLLEHAEQEMIRQAAGVATGDLAAVRTLTEALLLSGMAMSIVNQTAPLSGWEHAISHCLDLTAPGDGRPNALHGGQVGVATLVSARAYERAWDALDLDLLTRDREDDVYFKAIKRIFERHDPRGGVVEELRRDFAKKRARWRGAADARRRFIERKRTGDYDDFLRNAVRPASEIEDALRNAGAPCRFCDLDQPISRDSARTAVRFAHLIRARFTLGDLLTEAGWLTDSRADVLLGEPSP